MSPGREPLQKIVVRIRAGDRAACEEFVRHTYVPIYQFLVRVTSDTELAADLTQETFRTAWEKLAQFDGNATITSWLHRIAYNKFVDAYRRRGRDRAAQENARFEAPRRHESSACQAATERDSADQLLQAVEQLAHDQRTAVILHYFQGLSHKETAAILGQPVGTIKWRVAAALRNLRAMLDVESMI